MSNSTINQDPRASSFAAFALATVSLVGARVTPLPGAGNNEGTSLTEIQRSNNSTGEPRQESLNKEQQAKLKEFKSEYDGLAQQLVTVALRSEEENKRLTERYGTKKQELQNLELQLKSGKKKSDEERQKLQALVDSTRGEVDEGQRLYNENSSSTAQARRELCGKLRALAKEVAPLSPELAQDCILQLVTHSRDPWETAALLHEVAKAPINSEGLARAIFELDGKVIGRKGDRYVSAVEGMLERLTGSPATPACLYGLATYYLKIGQANRAVPLIKMLEAQHGKEISPGGETYENLVSQLLAEATHLQVGQPAPEVTATDIKGNTFKLSDFRGQITVVDFWGTWCAPCMRDIPTIREFRTRYPNVAVIGVNTDTIRERHREKDLGQLSEHIQRAKIDWTIAVDGSTKGHWTTGWSVPSFPHYYILDQDHIIVAKGNGAEDWEGHIKAISSDQTLPQFGENLAMEFADREQQLQDLTKTGIKETKQTSALIKTREKEKEALQKQLEELAGPNDENYSRIEGLIKAKDEEIKRIEDERDIALEKRDDTGDKICRELRALADLIGAKDPELRQRCLVTVMRYGSRPDRVLAFEAIGGSPVSSPELVDVIFGERGEPDDPNNTTYVQILERIVRRSEAQPLRLAALNAIGSYLMRERRLAEALPVLEELMSIGHAEVAPNGKTYGKLIESLLFESRFLRVGGTPPDVAATDIAGSAFKLSDLRGKSVVLEFLRINDNASLDQVRRVNKVLTERAEVAPIAIVSNASSEEYKTSSLRVALEESGVPWRVVLEGRQPSGDSWSKQWHTPIVPNWYLLDPNGIIIAASYAPKTWQRLFVDFTLVKRADVEAGK